MKKIDRIRKVLFTNIFVERIFLLIQKIPGCYAFSFKLFASNHLYPTNTIRKVERGGINYQLDIHDYQEWLIYTNADTDSSKKVLDYLKDARTILDVGANIGQTSFWIKQHLEKYQTEFTIHSFEPHPTTFKKFKTNLSLNNSSHIHAHPLGMGDQVSELELVEDCESNSGGYRIGKISGTQKGVVIPITTIDLFAKANNLASVDFIKIDVEGFEYQVLLGAKNSLLNYKPTLFIEFCPDNLRLQNTEPTVLLNYLQDCGYTINDAYNKLESIDLYTFEGMTDIICHHTN